ncbi:Coiled-coil protein [Giardia muris]|uniref:Coiled-coil protein n=1 Tax=Giardia muris TaxID=5742 RepID=A0A4Z1T3M6_GIAMU|nr:Coiled-coil protein [Giardia muris]|eukprot:TNJ28583.1 Coiled-coil protein [Giardia muris]
MEQEPEDIFAFDDESQMLLAPDHPLLRPIQDKLAGQMESEIEHANETVRELQRLKKIFSTRHEQTGVELYMFQRQLSDTQTRIETLEAEHASTANKRLKMQEKSKDVAARLQEAEAVNESLRRAEEALQKENQTVALEVIETAGQNEKLRSDALIRKRSVYRAEEHIKELERAKEKQDQYIADLTDEIKRLQDEETYLAKQLETQKETTTQANSILTEAYSQMETITADISNLKLQWELTLNAIEKRSASIKTIEEDQLSELDAERAAYRAKLLNCRRDIQKVHDEILTISDRTRARDAARQVSLTKIAQIREKQLVQLQSKYSALEASLEEAGLTLKSLEKTISQVVKETTDLSLKNDAKQQQIIDLENRVLIENAEQTSSNRQVQSLNAQLRNLKKDIERYDRDISKLCNEYSKRELDATTAETALESLQNARQALQAELSEKDALVTSYETQINKNNNSIEQRSSAITRLNRKLEEHQRSNPESDMGPLETTLTNISKEIAKAIKDVKTSQAQWLRAQTELVMCQKRREEEYELLNTKEDQRDVLLRKLREEEYKVESTELKIKAIQREIDHTHADISRLNAELGDAIQQEEKLNSENFVNEADALSSVENMEQVINGLEEKLERLKGEKAEAAGCLIEVEEQIQLWQRKIEIQSALLENVQSNMHKDSDGELAQLENECHKMFLRIEGLRKLQNNLLQALSQGVNLRESLAQAGRAREAISVAKKGPRTALTIQREVDELQKKLAEKQKTCEGLKQALEDAIRERARSVSEGEELAMIYERMAKKLESLRTGHPQDEAIDTEGGNQGSVGDIIGDASVEGV